MIALSKHQYEQWVDLTAHTVITELRRLIYTYSEYFYAQWVNCTKMCNKIQKTTKFSTYLPYLEALWHEIAHVFTVFALYFKIGPHWPALAVQFVNNFFSVLKKFYSFCQLRLKKRIILHFFNSREPTVQGPFQNDQLCRIPCWLRPPALKTLRHAIKHHRNQYKSVLNNINSLK